MATKSRLGKGLGALFPDLPGESQTTAVTPASGAATSVAKPVVDSVAKMSSEYIAKAAALSGQPATPATPATSAASERGDAAPGPTPAFGERPADTRGATGASSKSRGKRAAMPGLGDIAHPSDLFFGEPVAPPPSRQAAAAPSADDAKDSRQDEDDQPQLQPVQGGYLAELRLSDIGPNAHQPRTIFDEDELNELAASITEVGVLQPIVVRKRPLTQIMEARQAQQAQPDGPSPDEPTSMFAGRTDSDYELIMGERRWRASQLAGLETIPAIVKTTADNDMLRDALLENLHRVALNPLEEAAAYQQMIDEFGLTQVALSKSVSKSRPQIANTLRLLNLPLVVQKKVAAGILSAGHARALLALSDAEEMDKLATRIIAEGLSVRSTEEIVAMKIAAGEQPKKPRVNRNNPWANSPIQQNLEHRFDTKVSIKGSKKHGRIEIVFSSPEDMDRILGLLMDPQSAAPPIDGDWR